MPQNLFNLGALRARINGAKKACEAKRETHMRTIHLIHHCICCDLRLFIYINLHSSYDVFRNLIQDRAFQTLMLILICRKNLYDGIDEYYVIVKEKGSREQEESKEETRTSTSGIEAWYTTTSPITPLCLLRPAGFSSSIGW